MDYSAPVKEVEDEFLEFLIDWDFLKKTNTPSPLIMGHFITRKTLTQQQIRDLSALSIAKVYKEINKLEKNFGLIQKTRDKKNNQVLYVIENVYLTMVKLLAHGSERIVAWEEKFSLAKENLRKNKKKYENLEGYKDILHWVNFFLKIINFYKGTLLILEDIKEQLVKEKKNAEINEK